MRKLIAILLLFISICGFSQNGDGTLRTIDWKTIVKNVVLINDSTYEFEAEPIDLNDKGAIERYIGNYFVDFVGNRYLIIDSTSTTITVLDEYRKNVAPQSDQLGRVYRSVGDGEMDYVGGVDLTVIDELSRWKVQAADNEYWWRKIKSLGPVSYCPISMTVNAGTLNAGTVSDLCEVGGTDVDISEASGANPLTVTFTLSGIERLNSFVFYGNYDGGAGHVVFVEAYNYLTDSWDFIGEFGTSAIKQWYGFTIYQPLSYLNNGNVSVRIKHQDNGIPSHKLILDYVDVNAGGGGGSAFITASSIYFVPYEMITENNVQTAIQQFYDLWVSKDTSFTNELDSFFIKNQNKFVFNGDTISIDTANIPFLKEFVENNSGSSIETDPIYTADSALIKLRLNNIEKDTALWNEAYAHIALDRDTSPTNELQTLSWNGATGEISIISDDAVQTIDIDGRYLQTEVDGSVTNELITSVTFSDDTLRIVEAGVTHAVKIEAGGDFGNAINAYSNKFAITTSPIVVNWPVDFNNENYYLSVNAYYLDTIAGKQIRNEHAIYNFSKTVSGFSFELDKIAGFVEYFAADTTNLYPIEFDNYVSQADSTVLYVTPSQLNDSLANVSVDLSGYVQFSDTTSVIETKANAAATYQTKLTNPVTGTGTSNYLPKFTGASTLGNSLVSENFNTVYINANISSIVSSGYFINGYYLGGFKYYENGYLNAIYQTSNGNLLFDTSTENTSGANADAFPITRMTINNSGNISIGTSANSYKLDVNGDINIASGSNYKINGTNIASLWGAISVEQRTNSAAIKTSTDSVFIKGGENVTISVTGDTVFVAATGGGSSTFSGVAAKNSTSMRLVQNLNWNTEIYDTDNYHSTSSNTERFYAPSDGYYHISATVNNSFNYDKSISLTIRINNNPTDFTTQYNHYHYDGEGSGYYTAYIPISISGIVLLSTGDYISIYCSGSDINISGNVNSFYMYKL